jgi:hypothetical protein
MLQYGSFSPASFSPTSWAFNGIPSQVTGGHYGAWWLKKWEDQFKRKREEPAPTIEEIEEAVKADPVSAVEVAQKVAPDVVQGVTPKMLALNAGLIEELSLRIAIEFRRREADNDENDIEVLLLM